MSLIYKTIFNDLSVDAVVCNGGNGFIVCVCVCVHCGVIVAFSLMRRHLQLSVEPVEKTRLRGWHSVAKALISALNDCGSENSSDDS